MAGLFLVVVVIGLSASSCSGSVSTSTSIPDCGDLSGTVTGTGAIATLTQYDVHGTVKMTAQGTFEWTASNTGVADGHTASGSLSPPPTTSSEASTSSTTAPSRPLNGTAEFSNAAGMYTLTVTGTIVGPPKPCRASGTWTVTTAPGNKVIARGMWSAM